MNDNISREELDSFGLVTCVGKRDSLVIFELKDGRRFSYSFEGSEYMLDCFEVGSKYQFSSSKPESIQ